MIVSVIWSFYEYGLTGHGAHVTLAIITVLISLLMVSNLRYYSFKDFDLKNKVPFIAILAIVLFFVLVSMDPPFILLVTSLVFAASGIFLWLWKWRRKHSKRNHNHP